MLSASSTRCACRQETLNSKSVCAQALGIIHSMWTPVPGRFKDYIALPKPNMYQSLHSTVIGPSGERIEVQIRTRDMHQVSPTHSDPIN